MTILSKKEWNKRFSIVVKGIKQLPKNGNYYVGTFEDLVGLSGLSEGKLYSTVKKMRQLNILKTEKSMGKFGALNVTGFKILKESI